MRALSQSEYGEIRSLYESIYAPQVDEELELSDEELSEAVEDAVSELIEEGYDIDDIEDAFDDELIEEILDEAKITYGSDTESPEERRTRAKAKVGEKRSAVRKAAVKGAVKAAGEKAKEVKSEVGRRAGNVAVRAKAGATKTAMKATGVSPMDVPTKAGKQRKSADTFVAGRKADRDSAKAVIKKKVGDKYRGAKAAAGIAGSIAKDEARRAGRKAKLAGGKAVTAVKNAPEKAGTAARKGLKGLIRRGAEKVASGASKVAKRMSEEVETYDVVVEFLCDYGIAENLQEAQMMMVNEIDSEDIKSILEAYGLDEDMKPLPTSKIERQSNKAYAKEVVAARQGNQRETNKQMQRRIAMNDPAGRRAALKNKG